MKPNFALSLYFDKVELLHRDDDGWTSVGEVGFDSEDLPGALSTLRKSALTRDPAGLRTKLVLPDEQVKFLSLPEPNADKAAVLAALEDATPYAVDELVWEHSSDGRRTHIAAVARETLEEAEAFAVEHRFAPVSIVAQTVVGRFDGEPFFGETKAAAGLIGPDETVERDQPPAPMAKAEEAAPEPQAEPTPEPEPEPKPKPEPEVETAETDKATPDAEAKDAKPSTDAPAPVKETPIAAPTPEPAKPLAAFEPVPESASAKLDPLVEIAEPEPEPAPEKPVEPVFASRSRQARTGGDGPATTDPLTVAVSTVRDEVEPAKPKVAASAPAPAPASAHAPAAAVPQFTRSAPAEPRAAPQPVPPRAGPATPPPAVAERLARVAKANITADRIADMPPAAVAPVPPRPQGNGTAPPAPVVSNDVPPAATAKALGATLTPEEPDATANGGGLFSSRRQPEPEPAPRRGPPAVKVAPYVGEAEATPADRRGMTVFDQRAEEQRVQRGRSRLMLPILLAILLLFMAGVAAFAAIFTENGIAGLFGRTGTGDPILTAAPTDTTPIEVPGTPVVTTALDITLPGGADPVGDVQSTPDQLSIVTAPQGAALDPAVTADPVDTEDDIAQADPVVTPETPEGTVLSPAEAERFYAATGVWLRAPRLPFVPSVEGVSSVTTGDPATPTGARVVLATLDPPRALNDDVAPPVQLDPPGPDVVFERDNRGLLLATADGTLTPYGMLIYAGLPDVVPPTRPGTPLPEPVVEPVVEPIVEPVETPSEDEDVVAEATETTEDSTQAATAALEALVAESLASTDAPQDTADAGTVPDVAAEATEVSGPVIATADGVVTPEGVIVFAGLPDVVPPSRPEGLVPEVETAAADLPETTETAIDEAISEAVSDDTALLGGVSLAGLRPNLRPDTLEVPEAPVVLASFAGPRPVLRPGSLEGAAVDDPPAEPEIDGATVAATLAAIVASAPDPLAGATTSAVASAIVPEARPNNFDRVVAAAQARLASTVPQTTTTTTTTTQVTQPETVTSGAATPSGPIPQTVAGAATVEGAINLREINLIGVFGRPNDRRALVRLANGQIVRVGVGDALDGGQVTAIGDNVINYVKRGRTIALGVPG